MTGFVTCASCGAQLPIGTWDNVGLRSGGGPLFSVVCAQCGHTTEAAPGGSGVYSTIDGRLQRVADFVAHASDRELAELRDEIERLKQRADASEAAAAFMIKHGWADPKDRKRLATGNEALDFLLKLAAVLYLLKQAGSMAAEQIYQLFSQVFG